MSDLMKSIVQEVLNKQGSNTTHIQTQTVKSPSVPSGGNNTATLNNLKRPNYQKMKKEQRLSVSGQTAVPSHHPQIPKPKPKNPTNNNSQLDKNLFSQLSAVSLGQGKVEKRTYGNGAGFHRSNKVSQSPKLLGKTKDGSFIWYFPTVNGRLAHKFKRTIDGNAVGVITSKTCLPSQLLIVNDVMRENPNVKYHLIWDRNNKETFVWELYDQDAGRLEKKLQTILQIFNRKATKIIDSYTVVSPSAWLSKQLNIGSSVEAISVLEGVPYYASILLLEQYMASGESASFQFEIEDNYLILSGAHQVVSKLIQDFRRKAESLL